MRDDPDVLDASFAALVAALAAWTWIGIVLAEAGWFTRAGLLGLALPAAGAAAWVAFRTVSARRLPRAEAAALAAAMLAGAFVLARPTQPLVEGSDASVYLNTGRLLARHGALVYPEPLLERVPREDWDEILDRDLHPPRVLNLFPGGVQVVPGVNAVRPGFFHLLPVWIGSAELVAGPRAAYLVAPLAGLLALAGFWMLARQFATLVPVVFGAALLVANVAFQWFSRVTMTEVPAAALVLAGLAFSVRVARQAHVASGVLAGALFGLAAFVRVDVLLFVIPVVAAFTVALALERPGTRGWRALAATLAAVCAHAVLHAWLFADLYAGRIQHHLFAARSVGTASRVVPAVVLGLGICAWWLWRRGTARWLPRVAIGVFAIALAVAAARLAPRLTDGALPVIFTPAGTWLAVLAVAVWLALDRSSPVLLACGLWLVSMLVYAESPRDVGALPWTLRRYVPVVLPISTLALAVLADYGWRRGGAHRVLAAALATVLVAAWSWRSHPSRLDVLTGLEAGVARVADAIPADAVVLADVTTPSHLALSLYASFGRSVLFVMPADESGRVLTALARRLDAEGRPLMLAVGPEARDARGLAAVDLVGLEASPPHIERLVFSVPDGAPDALPRAGIRRERDVAIHRLRPRTPEVAPVTFEIGEHDLTLSGHGFHAVELMGSAYARWTGAEARIHVPPVAPLTAARLLVRLAGPRPAGRVAPTVLVTLNGQRLGEIGPIEAGFAVHTLPLPSVALAALSHGGAVLSLTTPTFSPAGTGESTDTRQLGVAVDWIRLEPADGHVPE